MEFNPVDIERFESIKGQELLMLIPQSSPFVMIDSLEYASETTAISTLEVKSTNVFF